MIYVLMLGVDDYIKKFFSLRELVLCINNFFVRMSKLNYFNKIE